MATQEPKPKPEINIPRPELDEYWKPRKESLAIASDLAHSFHPNYKSIDVGGRKGRSFHSVAHTVGWEGDIDVDLESFKLEQTGFADDIGFVYSRHTLEDLHFPLACMSQMARVATGWIETPSPAAELTRGVEVPYRRGYTHHLWVIGILDGVLTFIPKYPIVERFPNFDLSCFLSDPVAWNTYYRWSPSEPIAYRILRHERGFSLLDLENYWWKLRQMAIETVEYTTSNFPELFPPSQAEPKTMGQEVTLADVKSKEKLIQVESKMTGNDVTKKFSIPDKAKTTEQEPVSILVARFPHGGAEHPDVTDWLIPTIIEMKNDPRIKEIRHWRRDDTPITMSRNDAVNIAKRQGVDFMLMIDSDMCPDCDHPDNLSTPQWIDPKAKKFWPSTFDFAIQQRAIGIPCVVGAPYCGPPPHENIYVFHWQTLQSDRPEDEIDDLSLEQYTREHAAGLQGIQPCAALPTGLILIDMKAIEKLEPPYFYYEWDDRTEAGKASTEDVAFTRDLSMRGVEQYCNWDAWAGHWKKKLVGKPRPVTSQAVSKKFSDAVLRDHGINASRGEQLMDVKDGKVESIRESVIADRPTRPA